MENVIFDINHIYKIYGEMNDEPIIAVNDVSLKISKGDFLSIMGRSGSGKSTLINCISTIDRPSKGNIIINGKNVLDMHDDEISDIQRSGNDHDPVIAQKPQVLIEDILRDQAARKEQVEHNQRVDDLHALYVHLADAVSHAGRDEHAEHSRDHRLAH